MDPYEGGKHIGSPPQPRVHNKSAPHPNQRCGIIRFPIAAHQRRRTNRFPTAALPLPEVENKWVPHPNQRWRRNRSPTPPKAEEQISSPPHTKVENKLVPHPNQRWRTHRFPTAALPLPSPLSEAGDPTLLELAGRLCLSSLGCQLFIIILGPRCSMTQLGEATSYRTRLWSICLAYPVRSKSQDLT
jgi:hypothetical protein